MESLDRPGQGRTSDFASDRVGSVPRAKREHNTSPGRSRSRRRASESSDCFPGVWRLPRGAVGDQGHEPPTQPITTFRHALRRSAIHGRGRQTRTASVYDARSKPQIGTALYRGSRTNAARELRSCSSSCPRRSSNSQRAFERPTQQVKGESIYLEYRIVRRGSVEDSEMTRGGHEPTGPGQGTGRMRRCRSHSTPT